MFWHIKIGIIVDGTVFSDCLYADYITEMNNLVKHEKFSYD